MRSIAISNQAPVDSVPGGRKPETPAAVAQAGRSLEFADIALRRDRDVVLAAVAQAGLALRFADAALRRDRDVVLAAVALARPRAAQKRGGNRGSDSG